METQGEKKRAAYFTEAELEVLMLEYEEFKPTIMTKSNTTAAAKARQLAWQEITDRVNACDPSGARRTLSQVKMKHKNILQTANRKKADACLTGGGPPPPPLTTNEELALSLNKGRPVIDGIVGGTSSHSTSQNTSDLLKFADGHYILMDPPETTQSATADDDDDEEETTSAVTELGSAARPIELPANELYKVHLQRQIKKSDMEMDLIQLKTEERTLAIKKTKLEIQILEHRLKEMKK